MTQGGAGWVIFRSTYTYWCLPKETRQVESGPRTHLLVGQLPPEARRCCLLDRVRVLLNRRERGPKLAHEDLLGEVLEVGLGAQEAPPPGARRRAARGRPGALGRRLGGCPVGQRRVRSRQEALQSAGLLAGAMGPGRGRAPDDVRGQDRLVLPRALAHGRRSGSGCAGDGASSGDGLGSVFPLQSHAW